MQRRNIAIVGTGIAGNVAAHKLAPYHDVSVFEKANYIGGHSSTVNVEAEGESVGLDTGFLVHNDRTYPGFIALMKDLGVATQTSNMSFSVQCDDGETEYCGSSLDTLFAQRKNIFRPKFHRMVRDILRFNREAKTLLQSPAGGATLAEYLQSGEYSREFQQWYLLPMGAAIWSANAQTFGDIPVVFFARFFENHGLLDLKNRPVWRTIVGGSQAYVKKLVADHVERIRLNCEVKAIARNADHVELHFADQSKASFDHVVLACHSDQALRIVADPSDLEKEVLGSIPYQRNHAVLHSDESLMPKSKRAWAAWNHHHSTAGDGSVSVTYHLNRLQNLRCSKQFFVSLNCVERIREEAIIAEIDYDHPVFSQASIDAQRRFGDLNGDRRTWYCGAYWGNGFHEDGVQSALATVERMNMEIGGEERCFQRAS